MSSDADLTTIDLLHLRFIGSVSHLRNLGGSAGGGGDEGVLDFIGGGFLRPPVGCSGSIGSAGAGRASAVGAGAAARPELRRGCRLRTDLATVGPPRLDRM